MNMIKIAHDTIVNLDFIEYVRLDQANPYKYCIDFYPHKTHEGGKTYYRAPFSTEERRDHFFAALAKMMGVTSLDPL
jgi:hypothetical protein